MSGAKHRGNIYFETRRNKLKEQFTQGFARRVSHRDVTYEYIHVGSTSTSVLPTVSKQTLPLCVNNGESCELF